MEFRTCGKCGFYSRSLSRCKLGHINPRTKKQTKSAMKIMGTAYICSYSKWKDAAVNELVSEHRNGV